jgi:hypothetical protein
VPHGAAHDTRGADVEQVELKSKTARRNVTTRLVMSPQELMQQWVTLVPPPRLLLTV